MHVDPRLSGIAQTPPVTRYETELIASKDAIEDISVIFSDRVPITSAMLPQRMHYWMSRSIEQRNQYPFHLGCSQAKPDEWLV